MAKANLMRLHDELNEYENYCRHYGFVDPERTDGVSEEDAIKLLMGGIEKRVARFDHTS